jgi:nucleotide-binding universal stress UspA family protein
VRAPFWSEREGYEFVLLTVAAFSAIVVASVLGGAWAGVPVWAFLTAAALGLYARRGRARRRLKTAPAHASGAEGRVLVLALEPPAAEAVAAVRHSAVVRPSQVLVVCPAHVSSLRHWTSDVDGGRREAEQNLEESLERLRAAGIETRGEVADEDPLRAIEDAMRMFGADEIVVSTGLGPAGRELAEAVRERFAVPIRHIEAAAGLDERRPSPVQSL